MKKYLLAIVTMLCFISMAFAGNKIEVKWDPNTEPDLAGYKVHYKSGVSGPPYNGNVPSIGPSPVDLPLADLDFINQPNFVLNNLPDGTYWFVVTAYDNEGRESGYSNEVTSTVNEPPADPTGVTIKVTVTQNGSQVKVNVIAKY